METPPLVSIVLCTRNGQKFLREQLDSIDGQTYPNLEVICSDNNSTDDTPVILSTWCNKKAGRTLLSFAEPGLNKNFYNGIKHAKGTYIMFCDQDDIWLPEKTEKLVAFHEANKHASMVYCLSTPFKGSPVPAKRKQGINKLEGTEIKKTLLVSFTLGHNILIRRSMLDSLPVPADEVIAYDWWITVSAMCLGPVKCLPESLTYWRQHPLNTTKTLNKDLFYKSRAAYLQAWLKNSCIRIEDKLWITEARKRFLSLSNYKFSLSLFYFLLRNAHLIFFYKNKQHFVQKQLSFFKSALRMSRQGYRP